MTLYHLAVALHVAAACLWLGHMFFWSLFSGPALKKIQPAETAGRLRAVMLWRGGLGWPALAVLAVTGLYQMRFRGVTLGTLAGVVGFLAFVEFTSGVIQGYYTPMLTDIARHLGVHDADVNWLEGTQLMLSALVVPAFAKLGDMIGHKRMLVVSTAITAAASLVLPFTDSFGVFLAA